MKNIFMKELVNGATPEALRTALESAIEEMKTQEREREIQAKKLEVVRTIIEGISEYARLSGVEDYPDLTDGELVEFEKAFSKEFGVLSSLILGAPAPAPAKVAEFVVKDVDSLALKNFLKTFS